MCQFTTSWENDTMKLEEINYVLQSLQEMKEDGLLIIEENSIKVTEKGKPFVRNICMAFDLRLIRKAPKTQLFSMTI
jgi:oxygen-independent coproporphyrinogen III oxidase